MNFFQSFKQSIYDPVFYQSLASRPLNFSVIYYLKLILFIALIGAIIFSIIVLPNLISVLFNLEKAVSNFFPAELEITIKAGQVTTNVAEPYIIPLPANAMTGWPDKIKNLAVIDTATGDIISKFSKAETLILITADSFVYQGQTVSTDKSLVINKIPVETNMIITQKMILALIDRFDGIFVFIPPLMVILVFMTLIASFSLTMIYLVLIAFIIWALYKLFDSAGEKSVGYGTMYKTTLHAATSGLVGGILGLFILPIINPIFVFTLLTFLTIFVNMHKVQKLNTQI